MKAFSLALIVLGLCAASFAADTGLVEMSSKDNKGWGTVAGFALLYAAWWFFANGDDS